MRRLDCHAGTVYDGRIDMSRWRRQTMVVRLLLFVRFARCHVTYGGIHMLRKPGRVPRHRMEAANTTCKHPRLLQSRRRTSSQSTEPHQPIEPPTPHAHHTSRLFPSPRSPVRLLLHDCAAICGDWRLDDAHRAGSCHVYPGTRTSIIHA